MNECLSERELRAVNNILVRELGARPEQLTPESRPVADFGADSLTMIQILMAIEEEFEVAVPEEQWENAKTVGDLYTALGELLRKDEVKQPTSPPT